MSTNQSLSGTFAARWILPVSTPPIHGGWLRVEDDRIVAVEASAAPQDCIDLGDVALLPGLVNAHTHLEFSDLDRPLGTPGNSLPDWIGSVVRHRRQHAASDADQFKRQRCAAIRNGYQQSLESGVRLLGEIATLPWLDALPAFDALPALDRLPELDATPEPRLQVVAFAETLGLSPDRAAQTFAAATAWLQTSITGVEFGLSPHAPYSTSPQLVDNCLRYASQHGLSVAMHVAESREELELLQAGSGPFRDILVDLGAWQEGLFPRPGGVDETLQQMVAAPRGLIIHGNYLTAPQINMLAQHDHLSVVFCPRTHAYFQHDVYPLVALLGAGVRVALGTDSRSSNPDLCLWKELRHVLETIPQVSVEDGLRMATLWGADALGRRDHGRIAVGCRSGLLTVPTSAATLPQLWQALADCPQPEPLLAAGGGTYY